MHKFNEENNKFSLQIYLYTVEVFLSTYRRYKRNYLNVYTCMFTWLIYSTCHMSHVSTAKVNSDTAYKHTPVDNVWTIFYQSLLSHVIFLDTLFHVLCSVPQNLNQRSYRFRLEEDKKGIHRCDFSDVSE